MRHFALTLALVLVFGCQDREAEYAKALETYNTEAEILERMQDDRAEIIATRESYLGQIDSMVEQTTSQVDEIAKSFGDEKNFEQVYGALGDAREKTEGLRKEATEKFQQPIDVMDEKIAKHRERVQKAEKTLQEAENRR